MFYNDFEKALNARDRELWEGDEPFENNLCCKKCNQTIDEYYYILPFTDDKLCKNCAKVYVLDDINYFFTNQEMMDVYGLDSIEELTPDLIDNIIEQDILSDYKHEI